MNSKAVPNRKLTRRVAVQKSAAMVGGLAMMPLVSGQADSPRREADLDWLPLPDMDLEVTAGSPIDFSGLVERGPAGQHGWATPLPEGGIGFERRRRPSRFFGASFQFAPSNGGMPDSAEARRIVTQLVRTGYNAVRLQCVEAQLMSGRLKDFDFDPDQFDRFQFLLAELRAQGVYVVMDIAYNDNGAWGGVFPHRWIKQHDFRRDLYIDDTAKAHWRQLLKALLGRRNPYSGTVPLQDPALLALVLCNEGGIVELAFREGKGWDAAVPPVYAELFRNWLVEHYKSEPAWRRAWEDEDLDGESLSGRVNVPRRWRTPGARQRDFMRFVVDLEQRTYRWMQGVATAEGFRGLTTAFNNWNWLASDISRSGTSMVDMHAYHAHPTAFVDRGSMVAAESSLPDGVAYLRQLSSSRQWGKPFTVTEYGHAFWNQHRREACALVPAYAALQGWDLLTQFSENSLQLTYRLPQPSRRASIFPFTLSTDPVRRTGERLAALLYARGDVEQARGRIEFLVDSARELDRNGGWSQMADEASRLVFVTSVGLRFDTEASMEGAVAVRRDDLFVDKSKPLYWLATPQRGTLRREIDLAGLRGSLGRDYDSGRYVSDTGQIVLDIPAGRFQVATPRSVVWLGPPGPGQAGPLTVSKLDTPALIAACSLDDRALDTARHILLFLITDATNNGIAFEDAQRTRLAKLGGLPVKIRPVRADLSLANTASVDWKLWSLGQDGRRLDALSVMTSKLGPSFTLDSSALKSGPALMFELVAS